MVRSDVFHLWHSADDEVLVRLPRTCAVVFLVTVFLVPEMLADFFDFFFLRMKMNSEVSTRPKSRPQRVQKNCQRQGASCKHAESRPIHIAVNDKAPERTFAG